VAPSRLTPGRQVPTPASALQTCARRRQPCVARTWRCRRASSAPRANSVRRCLAKQRLIALAGASANRRTEERVRRYPGPPARCGTTHACHNARKTPRNAAMQQNTRPCDPRAPLLDGAARVYAQTMNAPRPDGGANHRQRGAVPWLFRRERPPPPAVACAAATRPCRARPTPSARIAAS
jgi:hypothetical protein